MMRHIARLAPGFAAGLIAATLAVPLALADGQSPIPQALGIAEGALSYCSSVDPGAAEGLRQLIGRMTEGTSERRLVEVRDSDEYRRGYDSVVDFTAKIAGPRNSKRFCTGEASARG